MRGVVVRLRLDGEQLLFQQIDGDRVGCLGLDQNDQFTVATEIGIYDAWRASPKISEYWGLVRFDFYSWESFSREQTFRWMRVKFRVRRVMQAFRSRVASFKKRVSVERYNVLSAVKTLMRDNRVPSSWDVAKQLLGEEWTDKADASDRIDQIENMLEALEDLGELRRNGIGFEVTGKGVAALSQYEEEERKHRETMSLQRGIKWLTVAMAVAALLQAKVIEFPPLWKVGSWPWN